MSSVVVSTPATTRTILIVDDDPMIRKLIATTLEDISGYRLQEAGDGLEAVERAVTARPEIVLHCRLQIEDCRLREGLSLEPEATSCYVLRRLRASARRSSSQSGLNRTSAPRLFSSRDTASSRK